MSLGVGASSFCTALCVFALLPETHRLRPGERQRGDQTCVFRAGAPVEVLKVGTEHVRFIVLNLFNNIYK